MAVLKRLRSASPSLRDVLAERLRGIEVDLRRRGRDSVLLRRCYGLDRLDALERGDDVVVRGYEVSAVDTCGVFVI